MNNHNIPLPEHEADRQELVHNQAVLQLDQLAIEACQKCLLGYQFPIDAQRLTSATTQININY